MLLLCASPECAKYGSAVWIFLGGYGCAYGPAREHTAVSDMGKNVLHPRKLPGNLGLVFSEGCGHALSVLGDQPSSSRERLAGQNWSCIRGAWQSCLQWWAPAEGALCLYSAYPNEVRKLRTILAAMVQTETNSQIL